MSKKLKNFLFSEKRKTYLLAFPVITLFLSILPLSDIKAPVAEADLGINNVEAVLQEPQNKEDGLVIFQSNTLGSAASPITPSEGKAQNVQKIRVIVTAYSSTPWETWGDPYITAAGTRVRKGIVANNLLPFGTEVRLPEIYGDKVFVVEDRMHSRKGPYHFDLWMPSYLEALNFGVKTTYVEVLAN